MILVHNGFRLEIDSDAVVAKGATVCGNVSIGKNTIIMHGAQIIAEGGHIEIGQNCVVLENAVLRSTERHSLGIGNNVLIGPNSHVVGCIIEDKVFVATGASIFHGARLCEGSEVRINAVVHIKSVLLQNETVPIGWVAVGNPAKILSPEKHDEIWAIQKPLNFPLYVYGVQRPKAGQSNMPEIMKEMVQALRNHANDEEVK